MPVKLAKTADDKLSFVVYILVYIQNAIIYDIFSYSVHTHTRIQNPIKNLGWSVLRK